MQHVHTSILSNDNVADGRRGVNRGTPERRAFVGAGWPPSLLRFLFLGAGWPPGLLRFLFLGAGSPPGPPLKGLRPLKTPQGTRVQRRLPLTLAQLAATRRDQLGRGLTPLPARPARDQAQGGVAASSGPEQLRADRRAAFGRRAKTLYRGRIDSRSAGGAGVSRYLEPEYHTCREYVGAVVHLLAVSNHALERRQVPDRGGLDGCTDGVGRRQSRRRKRRDSQ